MLREEQKRRRERHYIEEARKTSHIFPHGNLIDGKSPEPDFLLQTTNGTIGIEITEIRREQPGKEKAMFDGAVRDAKAIYSEYADARHVDVSVVFSREATAIKRQTLAKRLAEFVHANRGYVGSSFNKALPDGFDCIGIFMALTQTTRWLNFRAFDSVLASKELLESCITKKNKRFPHYRSSSPELWLLIVNDQFLGAGEVYLNPDHLAEWKFDFEFKKVLLFSRKPDGCGGVIEIQPE